ncbi:DUF7133 domain-containing protein [Arcticibacterium luteifluviistationis]|uniref:Dehydrogenase n=1 Tax=Arcticibacterium luteifluviistationis TaxID=1784714 RepID=A0A2Z4G8X1_9BACT|nr:c-type cytochrome [Arcticibacterium luteifluviistationis]AWV97555.1 dehydrogenase [Arcticibacterium luteifluviistationis]
MKFNLIAIFLATFLLFGMKSSEEPSLPKSPEEEKASFELAEGFNIELAAAEPLVEDPVLINFDKKGRMWVVEMRAYMPNIDGTGEEEPIGRVSYLEDVDGDGEFDKRTTYADSLVLPRALYFYQDGVLIAENIPLWFYEDTNGDGKGDKRTLVDSTYGGNGLPEHSANGLLLGLDNWLYNAKSKYRYKRDGDKWIKEETEFRGQWGIAKDDFGKLYYNYNWSQLHADLVPPNYFNRNPNYESSSGIDQGLAVDRSIYPIHPTPAVNRGYIPGVLDEDKKLMEFTSACAPFVSRDKKYYQSDFYGNVLVCEPAGNLVKRNIITENGNYLDAEIAYYKKEFLASSDDRFRPSYITSGPDGAIYLVDMYRGISQHKAYMTEYLREQTLNKGLEKTIHLGRIWKITPDGFKSPSKPTEDLGTLSSEKLVAYLGHPLSWYRDNSQRLLLQQNRTDAKKSLVKLAKKGEASARIAALWILEGLDILDTDLCLALLTDKEPKVQANALRLLEPAALEHSKIRASIQKILRKVDTENNILALQVLLSSTSFDESFAIKTISHVLAQNGSDLLLRDAALTALNNREFALIKYINSDPEWDDVLDFKQIILEQLSGILVKRKDSKELAAFFELMQGVDGWQKEAFLMGASLQALSTENTPIALEEMPEIFKQDKLSTIKNLKRGFKWPGKVITETEETDRIKLDANGMKQFVAGRQTFLTYCAGCHGSDGGGMKRFAPPLAGSEWVTGNPERLALILLHGIEGAITVKGKVYDTPDILPVMPSHASLPGQDMANVMTYIRNEWGHSSEPVSPRTVGMLRLTSQGKVVPWTPEELNAKMAEKP